MQTNHWNAGDAVCGALIAGLKRRLDQTGPGQLLQVTANSAGAPVDLPAWCRVTGNELVEAEHPVYVIRKKDD